MAVTVTTTLHLLSFVLCALAEAVMGLLLWLVSFGTAFREVPHVAYVPTPANAERWLDLRSTLHAFQPAPWAALGRAQSLFANLPMWRACPYTHRETLCLPDDVSVTLDWKVAQSSTPRDPIVFICPGIAGSSASRNVHRMADAALKMGWRAAVYNRRGHYDGSSLLPKAEAEAQQQTTQMFKAYPMHCDTDDLHHVAQHIRAAFPYAPMLLVGTSAGACLAVKYLAQHCATTPFSAAASTSNGHELVPLTHHFAKHPQANALMLHALRGLLQRNAQDVAAIAKERNVQLQWQRLLHANMSVRDFEEQLMLPLRSGFSSIDYYYNHNSCHTALKQVRTPLLTLGALDDPLIPAALHEHAAHAALTNPHVFSVITRRGGHLGWLTGWRGSSWETLIVMTFFQSVLQRKRLD